MKLRKIPTSKSSKVRVALTIGDPAGIGPAITLKAYKVLKDKADITIIASRFVLCQSASLLKMKSLPKNLIDLDNISKKNFSFGKQSPATGRAAIEYLDKALDLLKHKKVDCLVTCPISKEAINLAGYKFSGHTEYLADKTNCGFQVMMLVNNKLKFSLVTRHIGLNQVSGSLNKKDLERNILDTNKALKKLFSINRPRIVVCAVNPHASDNGLLGKEEGDLIIPVLKKLKKRGLLLTGPLSSDIAIAAAAKAKFDCVIACYHDQALIPLKLTDPDSGVNLTVGLPFVRTSPLHGTAFDIAARPSLANPASLISAINLAIKCTLNQRKA